MPESSYPVLVRRSEPPPRERWVVLRVIRTVKAKTAWHERWWRLTLLHLAVALVEFFLLVYFFGAPVYIVGGWSVLAYREITIDGMLDDPSVTSVAYGNVVGLMEPDEVWYSFEVDERREREGEGERREERNEGIGDKEGANGEESSGIGALWMSLPFSLPSLPLSFSSPYLPFFYQTFSRFLCIVHLPPTPPTPSLPQLTIPTKRLFNCYRLFHFQDRWNTSCRLPPSSFSSLSLSSRLPVVYLTSNPKYNAPLIGSHALHSSSLQLLLSFFFGCLLADFHVCYSLFLCSFWVSSFLCERFGLVEPPEEEHVVQLMRISG